MNGSSSLSPELPLPMPSPEQGTASPEVPGGIEKKFGAVDSASQGPITAMPTVDPSQFATTATTAPVATSDDQAGASGAVATAGADDADVIEKEWVVKAKTIVNNTRSNPNQQSNELSKFKAEYIKKRFNKEVKTVRETPASS